jgi:hypothetical protein
MEGEKLRMVYQGAREFLEEAAGKEVVEKEIQRVGTYRIEDIHDLYWHLLSSLANKRNMMLTIGEIDPLAPFFFDFDPLLTNRHYDLDWKKLFRKIKRRHKPPGPMEIANEGSYWVVFCKGALSGAAFLASFGTFEALDAFIRGFQHHDLALPALPMILEREIYGLGFALSCDFLKECGYTEYGKPDVHVKDILHGLGLVESRDDYEVFKCLLRMARACEELPAVVDKILYLIGSGKVASEVKIGRQKKAFIDLMKARLGETTGHLEDGRCGDEEKGNENPEGEAR